MCKHICMRAVVIRVLLRSCVAYVMNLVCLEVGMSEVYMLKSVVESTDVV